MKRIYSLLVLLILFAESFSDISVELNGGGSFITPYTFIDTSDSRVTTWLNFAPITNGGYSGIVGIDLNEQGLNLGLFTGFHMVYTMELNHRTGSEIRTDSLGMIASIPVLLFVEQKWRRAYGRFGVGPSITRFNYTPEAVEQYDIEPFTVQPLFTFLFGGGYRHPLSERVELTAGGAFLIAAPMKLWEFLPEPIVAETEEALNQEYNRFDYVSLIGNFRISLGVRFCFGKGIALNRLFGI